MGKEESGHKSYEKLLEENRKIKKLNDKLTKEVNDYNTLLKDRLFFQKLNRLGNWIFDIETEDVKWSQGIYDIFGIKPGTIEPHLDSILGTEKENYFNKIMELCGSKETGTCENTLINSDGKILNIFTAMRIIRNDAKEPVSISGTVQDITNYKNIENELEKKQEQLEIIFNNTSDMLALLSADKNYTILNVNNSVISILKNLGCSAKKEDITNIPLKEALLKILKSEDNLIEISHDKFSEIKKTGKSVSYEKTYNILGNKLPVRITLTPVMNNKNKCIYLLWCASNITEIMEKDKALRTSAAQLENAAKIAKLGYWEYDVDAGLFTFNDPFYAIFRTTAEKEGGYHMKVEQYAKRFLHPEDAPIVGAETAKALESDDPDYSTQIDHRVIFDNGEIGYITVRVFIEKDDKGRTIKTYGANQDITERKRVENALKESEENLRITLNSIADAVIAADVKGRIMRMNPVAENLTGWKFEEAENRLLKEVYNILDPDTNKEINSAVQDLIIKQNTTHVSNNSILLSRDETKYRIAESSAPIKDEKGNIMGIVLVFSDITERYQMEEQLQHTRKMDAIGKLAGGIAHDFNNMLSGILGASEILALKIGNNEGLKKYVNLIKDASVRAGELTQKLLVFSRKSPAISKPFNMHKTLDEASAILERSIDKRITIKKKYKADITTVTGNSLQIQNSILNLGVNSRDAMPDGGLILLETRNIELNKNYCTHNAPDIEPGMFIEIRVTDTGIGMDKKTKERIFEPYFTTKGIGKGTGLGLAAVYGNVKDHKGMINAISEPGQGTTIEILLPVSRKKVKDKKHTDKVTKSGTGRILVVDDEDIVRNIASDILLTLGYEVVTAVDGMEAINTYKKEKENIDLVLLDLIMPRKSGAETFDELKKINPDCKIIITSGYAQDTNTMHMINSGACDFIQKPYNITELSQKISVCLKNNKHLS